MNSKKLENLQKQIQQAEAKKRAILENSEQLESKKQRIEEQIAKNSEKIEKIDFFLEKTRSSLQG